jgi:hypothetical protein
MRTFELKSAAVDKVTGKQIKGKSNIVVVMLGTTISQCYVRHSDGNVRLHKEDGIFEFTPENFEKYLRNFIALYGDVLNSREIWTWASNGKTQPPRLEVVS